MKSEDIVNFIESKNNIKLMDFQKQMIDCILKGETFCISRRSGRSLIVEGICDYIKHIHEEHIPIHESKNMIITNDKYKIELNKDKSSNMKLCELEYIDLYEGSGDYNFKDITKWEVKNK